VRLDDRVTIATPEGVTLELVLAGLGSRFVARLLDSVIQLFIIIALGLSAYALGASGAVLAVDVIVIFLVALAYDVPFELLNGGRTIGKMTAGIRVVGTGGEPVAFLGSAIRNILRLIDFLPILYLTGAITIIFSERDQRLGDLAAGTVVVRDTFPGLQPTVVAPLTVPADAVTRWDVSAIDAQDVATIRQFLDRRLMLAWHVRMYFGSALAARVAPMVAGAPPNAHPEYLLEGIVVAKQQRG
jgi:uncharacterized RDD family membrane protein YckC